MNFFKELISAESDTSSKRFAGLSCIAVAMAGAILSYVLPEFTEVGESMAKTFLITGAGLLGFGVVEKALNTVKRPVKVEVEDEKTD